jgi:CheY-like chemotaxis protein
VAQRVLAIDDSPDVHRLLDIRLRPEALIIHHALDAERGLSMAVELLPDLILLDVDLPLMTGFEVCQRLKLNPARSSGPACGPRSAPSATRISSPRAPSSTG